MALLLWSFSCSLLLSLSLLAKPLEVEENNCEVLRVKGLAESIREVYIPFGLSPGLLRRSRDSGSVEEAPRVER